MDQPKPSKMAAEPIIVPPPIPSSEITQARIDAAVDALKQAAQYAVDQQLVPGLSIAIAYWAPADESLTIDRLSYGIKHIGETGHVTIDTVFALASVSKPITATALGALMTILDEKAPPGLTWNQPTSYTDSMGHRQPFELFGRSDATPVRELVSHRSGLRDHDGDLLEDIGYKWPFIVGRLPRIENLLVEGTYAYTNMGYTAGAYSFAYDYSSKLNEPGFFADYAKTHLFDRLGMTRTSYPKAPPPESEDVAWPHIKLDGQKDGPWIPVTVAQRRDPSQQAPAGGAYSTAADMARFLLLHLGRGISPNGARIVATKYLDEGPSHTLPPDAQDPATGMYASGQAGTGEPLKFYGYGWEVVDYRFPPGYANRRNFNHSGGFSMGASTFLRIDIDARVAICILTNGEPVGAPEALVTWFFNQLYGYPVDPSKRVWGTFAETFKAWSDYMWSKLHETEEKQREKYAKPPTHPKPPRPLDRYQASFGNDFYPDVTVTLTGDVLTYCLNSKVPANADTTFTLQHWDGDVFIYETYGENAIGPVSVRFTFDGDGAVASLIDESLNRKDYVDGAPLPHGLGELSRRRT